MLGVAFIASLILEFTWLTNLEARRRDSEDSRDDGAVVYAIFRYFNLFGQVLCYLPGVYIVEKYGVNKSLTLAMILCSTGLWLNYAGSDYTMASFFIGLAYPFVFNVKTKIATRWFGPLGRTVAVMFLFLG